MTMCTIDDGILQKMMKDLTQLKELYICDWSDGVSEFGITGVRNLKQIGNSISNLKNLECLFLHIMDAEMTDVTIEHVAKLERLRVFDMYYSPS